jgi:hypothetical protein
MRNTERRGRRQVATVAACDDFAGGDKEEHRRESQIEHNGKPCGHVRRDQASEAPQHPEGYEHRRPIPAHRQLSRPVGNGRRQIFANAVSASEPLPTAEVKEHIARFLHSHKDHKSL